MNYRRAIAGGRYNHLALGAGAVFAGTMRLDARKVGVTVTALRNGTALLQVEVAKVSAGILTTWWRDDLVL
jgi:hypothetical protein